MSFRTRHGRLLASIAAAGLLLAGCGSGPSQAGAAAIVGDTRIPVTDVQSWFTEVLERQPEVKSQLREQGAMDDLGRQLASQLVRQELLEQTARDERLTVTDQQIAARLGELGGPEAATEGMIYGPQEAGEMVRTQLLTAELGRKYIDRLAVTFDLTQASTRREAEEKARRMALGPQQAAELVAEDKAAGLLAGADQQLRPAESLQLAATTPLFGAAPGTVLAFEQTPQSSQWLVVRIKDRRVDAAPQQVNGVEDGALQQFGTYLLGITADRAGVQLSPRYGVWDPVSLAAVPSAGETTGFRLQGTAQQS
ncbi:SurA N-terminal domain-containing protein [Saccharopolyspora antimicrobica]|uniref:SurA N-terminal domain-containing protein n=1 Tax=Saccharopolyspora antimicrobica TaxID=455193 RepID=A0A1I5ESF5_9PSEU|nr:SurA N-terminal domain-containing protein [Saccharopolyspora antimicrobica]RKT83522.1 SurA-like protein [Saccharopolyspora antimicrobica]SFO14444.1 SurA N-terminal domain-containing protein [Saccharopolyspora antimicrobica]